MVTCEEKIPEKNRIITKVLLKKFIKIYVRETSKSFQIKLKKKTKYGKWKQNEKRLSENFEINKNIIQYFNADLGVKVIKKLLEEYTKHFEAESEGVDSTGAILDGLTSIISSVEEKIQNLTGFIQIRKSL